MSVWSLSLCSSAQASAREGLRLPYNNSLTASPRSRWYAERSQNLGPTIEGGSSAAQVMKAENHLCYCQNHGLKRLSAWMQHTVHLFNTQNMEATDAAIRPTYPKENSGIPRRGKGPHHPESPSRLDTECAAGCAHRSSRSATTYLGALWLASRTPNRR
ncbi:hypothetical protein EMPG_09911 [Blastomyces silverae]|uniref:Uncharacterized protein n=1 Tax=Blastomyces silverae TaxID=2060906 RepID=A0A0H1BF38_9EURO|nr:hypothetical protein EMPG_09911 [Blastomyces silverae]